MMPTGFSLSALMDIFLLYLLGEDSGDALRVAVDRVEEPGEGEAENGSQEKHPNHYLLLDWSHE